jgi:hypothetical protein
MSNDSLSEEMRAAFFGPASSFSASPKASEVPKAIIATPSKMATQTRPKSKSLSPKLRVTLRVSKTFEGAEELFVYEADILSPILAEHQPRAEAKKNKFR